MLRLLCWAAAWCELAQQASPGMCLLASRRQQACVQKEAETLVVRHHGQGDVHVSGPWPAIREQLHLLSSADATPIGDTGCRLTGRCC